MSNCNLLKEAMDFVDYIKTKQPLSEEQLTKLSSTLENLVNTINLQRA
jgi:hypothetical protein